MATRDAFFKIITGPDSFERIKIAPGYVNNKLGNIPSMVILRDKYGNHWHVNVEKEEKQFCFVKGWKMFTDENHLEIGDFIVFYQDGHNLFNVVLLGHDSCEKMGIGGLKNKIVEEEGENIKAKNQEATLKDSQCEPIEEDEVELYFHEQNNKKIDMVVIDDDDEDEVATNVKNKEIQPEYEQAIPVITINIVDMDEDEVRFADDFNINGVQKPKSVASRKGKIIKEKESEHERASADIVDMDVDEGVQKPKSGAYRKGKIIEEKQSENGRVIANKAKRGIKGQNRRGAEIFQDRNLSPPKNPYFVAQMRRERRNQVLIPAHLIRKHNLQLPKHMLLQDTQGREWKAQLTTWQDGRKWYFGGWYELCKENSVQKEDSLVCEFAEKKGKQQIYLKVQILSA